VSPSGWAGLAQAAEMRANEIVPEDVANTLDALSKIGAAAAAVSASGCTGLAEAIERTAPTLTLQGREMTLRGARNPT